MSAADSPHTYELDGFRLEPARRLLTDGAGAPVLLTAKAFDALVHLVAQAGQLVTRAALTQALWPKTVVEDNNLNQAIAVLRRTLGERHIATVAGSGYQWVTPVRVMARSVAEPVRSFASDAPSPAIAPSRKHLRFALGVGLVAAVVALGLYAANQLARDAAAREPVLAVLPFENQSPDPDAGVFADGIHTEILSTLTNGIRGVTLTSQTTMRSYRGTTKTLREIATELGATHVLEGAVRLEGERIRLTLQLIDASTDTTLRSSIYDEPLSDALPLQIAVARMVAAELSAELVGTTASTEAPPPVDAEIVGRYLRAKTILETRTWRPAIIGEALRMLDAVTARDRSFLPAYLDRIQLRILTSGTGREPRATAMAAARADLAIAQDLAPSDPTVIGAAAQLAYLSDDYTAALRLFDAAEARGLQESSILAFKAHALFALGRWDEALALERRLATADIGIVDQWLLHATLARKTTEALDAAKLLATVRGDRRAETTIAFMFGGDFGPVVEYDDDDQELFAVLAEAGFGYESRFHGRAYFLRLAGRFAELEEHARRASVPAIRTIGLGWETPLPPGWTPTAEYRGWAALLNGNDAVAAAEGRAVLSFVADQDPTARDAWHARALAAAGYRFTGDKTAAIRAAREAMTLTTDAVFHASAQIMAAQVLAWSGAHGEALDLLEHLSTSVPGLPPAAIARDPIFSIPLADEPRYRSLAHRLEAEMAAETFGE